MRFLFGTAVLLILASPALCQIDSAVLRARYGVPLNRETFKVRPNIEMVVDYGSSGHACRIELPPGESIVGQAPPSVATKEDVDEVLAEVVPPSLRGKETGRYFAVTGAPAISVIEYEHVTVIETQQGGMRTSIVATFKGQGCQPPTAIR